MVTLRGRLGQSAIALNGGTLNSLAKTEKAEGETKSHCKSRCSRGKMTSRTKILKNDVYCNVQTFAFVDKESDRFHSVPVALFVITYITSP